MYPYPSHKVVYHLQLSNEVGRIASTLANLALQPELVSNSKHEAASSGNAEISVDAVRDAIRARRLRYQLFDKELFADPAWDMLLDLFQAELAQIRIPVSALCTAAAVPPTTALRWIKTMTDADLFRRRADAYDGRRIFMELSPAASAGMRRYFEIIGNPDQFVRN